MKCQIEISDVPVNSEYPVIVKQVGENGVVRGPYYITIDNLIKALKQEPENLLDADGMRMKETSTPPLPFGTIRYSSNEPKTKQRITLEIPKKEWDIRYGDEMDSFYRIGFPRMIVQFLVVTANNISRVDEMRIYAVEDNKKPITDETPLHMFPYPNVGKGNAIVCWGQNQRLEIQSLVELERAFHWFTSAPFNEDHGVRTTLGIPLFRQLIEKIEDKKFDDEWLIPMNKTFGDLYNI
ncbi:hypothetical protein [Bacillus cihuensis]|uniref:hypothetical protein n=1 Tax=Bacillus cihuensis TaxID=1208599 RepID=UPI00042327BE|nr:hypothetical protein [Bacillus cihuensis]